MKYRVTLLIFFLLILLPDCASVGRPRIGQTLPQWRRGELDIHLINSGRGECSFIILPDGTTVAVDAGEMIGYRNSRYGNVLPKPDSVTRPVDVYARYMRHFLPSAGHDSLDYLVLTHYHMDHMNGVPALYERLPFRMLLDRSYPDYSENIRSEGMAKDISFYSDFVRKSVEFNGLKANAFVPGSENQIVPLHAAAFPCRVLNFAASGKVWDGTQLVSTAATRENSLSCAFLLSYGKFDYWTSGDNNHMDMVRICADAVGPKLDAQKCLHHMSNPDAVEYEAAVMQPQVILTASFYVRKEQPQQSIIRNLTGRHDLFFTNIDRSIIDTDPELYAQCKGINGHFVIRVSRGGRSFRVYQLDDTDFSYRVTAVHGPYKCR